MGSIETTSLPKITLSVSDNQAKANLLYKATFNELGLVFALNTQREQWRLRRLFLCLLFWNRIRNRPTECLRPGLCSWAPALPLNSPAAPVGLLGSSGSRGPHGVSRVFLCHLPGRQPSSLTWKERLPWTCRSELRPFLQELSLASKVSV